MTDRVPRRAVFLDRDGTLIIDAGYLRVPAQVELLSGVGEALRELQRQDFALVVVSNQSGIARGLIKQDEADRVHQRMQELLAKEGVRLDGAYYCPHAPADGCECRKPGAALLHRAALDLDIALAKSFMVGDKVSDCQAGASAGCRSILLQLGPIANPSEFCCANDWRQVLEQIANG